MLLSSESLVQLMRTELVQGRESPMGKWIKQDVLEKVLFDQAMERE